MTAGASGLEIDLAVEAGSWPDDDGLLALADRAALATAEIAGIGFDGRELSLVFTDDEHIGTLNADWRGKAKPTNVLSFPVPEFPPGMQYDGPLPIGDIVLGYETVAREAAEAGLTLADHIAHLLVHGLLHLHGYDHEDDAEADAMERLEAAILARLGIADPYAGSDPEHSGTAGGIGS